LGDANSGEEAVVKAIKVQYTKLTKNAPFQIILFIQNPNATALARNRTIFDLKMAIETKEVVNPKTAMTKER
jgi:hypothetical protein